MVSIYAGLFIPVTLYMWGGRSYFSFLCGLFGRRALYLWWGIEAFVVGKSWICCGQLLTRLLGGK